MSVTLHTSHGDLKLELFCDLVPKTCEVLFESEVNYAKRVIIAILILHLPPFVSPEFLGSMCKWILR
jgi:hypothetical protein